MINTRGKVLFAERVITPEEANQIRVHRGDIFMIDLGSDVGSSIDSEQKGYRPAIVIQNDVGNAFSSTTIVALGTTQLKPNLPTHMTIDLYEPTIIMAEQVRTISKSRIKKKVGRLKREYINELNHCLAVSFGLIDDFHYTGGKLVLNL